MKGTGAKRNVCPGSCASTGAKFPVAPVESAPMVRYDYVLVHTSCPCPVTFIFFLSVIDFVLPSW